MKKLKLKASNIDAIKVLSRVDTKKIMGGGPLSTVLALPSGSICTRSADCDSRNCTAVGPNWGMCQ